MAGTINSISATGTRITLPIPRPMIIWSDMKMEDWKHCFEQKKLRTVIPDEEYSYQKCLKALFWAEFCNGVLVKVGNSKEAINFTFEFPNLKCKNLFDSHFDTHLAAVTLIENR